MKQYQQGDVLLSEVKSIPKKAIKENPIQGYTVLAYGEISGHAHCLLAEKTELLKHAGKTYLRVKEDCDLAHHKLDGSAATHAHKPFVVKKGDYLFGLVQEFDYFTGEARNVAD